MAMVLKVDSGTITLRPVKMQQWMARAAGAPTSLWPVAPVQSEHGLSLMEVVSKVVSVDTT